MTGYTTNFSLPKPDFDAAVWHDHMWQALDLIDGLIKGFYFIENFKGLWKNSTAFVVGDRALDINDGLMYQCAVSHTSAASGTFSADRVARPTYWTVFTFSVLAEQWALKAKDWAISTTLVDATDYSAKSWAAGDTIVAAGSAKRWAAETAGILVDGANYSAKHYSLAAASIAGALGNPQSQGLHSIFIPAVAITVSGAGTNHAIRGAYESPTNKTFWDYVEFDPTTQKFAIINVEMPKSYNGGPIYLRFVGFRVGGSNTGIVMTASAVHIGEGDLLDTAYGTGVDIPDDIITDNTMRASSISGAITPAGTFVYSDVLQVRLARNVAHVSDTMTVGFRLLGVLMLYTVDKVNDA